MLTGCTSYSCGEYTVNIYGTSYTSGEWCGLFGSYGFDRGGRAQILITPSTRDFELDAQFTDWLAVSDLQFDASLLAEGETITLDDGLDASCFLAPGGAGSGTSVDEPATSATLTIGRRSNRTQTGQYSHHIAWDVTCASTSATGEDWIEFDD